MTIVNSRLVRFVKKKPAAAAVKKVQYLSQQRSSFLDQIDLRSKKDYAIYKKRQMIVEHLFGTIKRWWDGGYFLTRGIEKVSTETALTYTAYNFKRVVNILGVEEMVKRLQERGKPVLV